nr:MULTISPECIES: DUF2992 family protein [unclassified Neochlamydia]
MGGEPSDPEIHKFVLNHYPEIKFGEVKEINIQILRMNPKRVQREVRREMARMKETTQPSTLAQDYRRGGLEKKRKKIISSAEKQDRKDDQFALKQKKRKREASRALLKRYHR